MRGAGTVGPERERGARSPKKYLCSRESMLHASWGSNGVPPGSGVQASGFRVQPV